MDEKLGQKIMRRLKNSVLTMVGICCIDDVCLRLGFNFVGSQVDNAAFFIFPLAAGITIYFAADSLDRLIGKRLIAYFERRQQK